MLARGVSRTVTRSRAVLVALFLISGARSAGAWHAMPGPPAAPAQEPPPVAAPAVTTAPPPSVRAPAAVHPRPVERSVTIEQQPPPPPGAYGEEWRRGGGQLLLGTTVMAVLSVAAFGILVSDQPEATVLVILPAPIAAGYMVCRIGQTSRYYGGGCGAAMGGAYLGALTAIPLALIIHETCTHDQANASVEDWGGVCLSRAAIGFVIGYTVGTALGATLGWHIGKERRPAAAPYSFAIPPARDTRPELGRGPSGSRPPGVRLSVPLLAFSF